MTNLEWFKIELFSSLPPRKLRAQQNKLVRQCFGRPKNAADENDKWCDEPYARLLAIEKGKVIGNATLVRRKIKLGKKEMLIGGIRGVCTKKEKRGMGVASALMKRAMKELEKLKCDIGFLGMNPNNKKLIRFYSNFGFVFVRKQFTYSGESGKKYTDRGFMVAKIYSKSKFEFAIKSKSPFYIGVGAL